MGDSARALCEEIRKHVVRRMGFEPSQVIAAEKEASPETRGAKWIVPNQKKT